MAFDYTNLYPDTSSNGGYTKSWNYTTLDLVAVVTAPGYFNKVATRLGIGDTIVVAIVDAFDTKSRTAVVDATNLLVTTIAGGVVTTRVFKPGLDNVDNTSDASKPVSTAQAAAIANAASFVAAGTGAATRTSQDKARDIIGALDFSAVGDGVTNNFTPLQNAITAASGKEVYIPAGTYAVTIPSAVTYATPGANTVIRGAGKNNTILTFNTASLDGFAIFNLANAGVTFRDLTLQMVSDQGSFSPAGVYLSIPGANNLTFENVKILGNNVDGATIGGAATNTDTVRLTFTSSALTGSPITVSYTVGAGNSTSVVATGLAAAVNANGVLSAAGVSAVATGAFVGIIQADTLTPKASFTGSVTGAATETVTIGTSTGQIAFLMPSSGEQSDFKAINVDVEGMNWVVLKSNSNTSTNKRWKFTGGVYNKNANGHINLNSPNGTFDDVLVMGATFLEPSPNALNAFAVAGARVTKFKVIGNQASGTYNSNVFHFEEGCNNLTVTGNQVSRYTSTSLGAGFNGTGIFITDNNISGSYLGGSNIVISGNNISAVTANNSGYGLWTNLVSVAQNGASITGNVFAGFFNGVELNASQNYSMTGNVFRAFVAAGTGIKVTNGPGVVSGNAINAYPTPLTNLAATVSVVDNLGYNPVGASAVTPSASPYTYTASGSPETLYVSASTSITALTQGGVSILPAATAANAVIPVQFGPNESAVITYTGTLTAKKMVH